MVTLPVHLVSWMLIMTLMVKEGAAIWCYVCSGPYDHGCESEPFDTQRFRTQDCALRSGINWNPNMQGGNFNPNSQGQGGNWNPNNQGNNWNTNNQGSNFGGSQQNDPNTYPIMCQKRVDTVGGQRRVTRGCATQGEVGYQGAACKTQYDGSETCYCNGDSCNGAITIGGSPVAMLLFTAFTLYSVSKLM